MEDYENVTKRFYKWLYGALHDFINIKFNHKASHDKKVDQFDFSFQPSVDRKVIDDLMTMRFIPFLLVLYI